jgi:hypothetical protein
MWHTFIFVWLAGLTLAGAYVTWAYIMPTWDVARAGTPGLHSLQAQRSVEHAYLKPLADVSQKRLVLPAANLSISLDPALGDVLYNYNSSEDGTDVVLTNSHVVRHATSRWASTMDNDLTRPDKDEAASHPDKDAFDCQRVLRLTNQKTSGTDPLATVQVKEGEESRTLYAYPGTDRNCEAYWSQDGYGKPGEPNALLNRFVEAVKSAESVSF